MEPPYQTRTAISAALAPFSAASPRHLPQNGLSPPRRLPRLPAHAGKVGARLLRSTELTASAMLVKRDGSKLTFNKLPSDVRGQEEIISRDCKVFFYATALKKKISLQPCNQVALESSEAARDASSREHLLRPGKPTAALRNSRYQSDSWEQR